MKQKEIRNQRLEIRLTEKENVHLIRQAGDMDLSKYVRQKLFADNRDMVIPDKNIELELRKLNSEVNRIGVNINQIVRDHNSGIYTEQDKWYLIQDIEKIKDILFQYRKILLQKISDIDKR